MIGSLALATTAAMAVVEQWLAFLLTAAAVSASAYAIYFLWFVPFEQTKRLGEVGFGWRNADRRADKELVRQLCKSRRVGEAMPPPFPNGWFALTESCNVRPGNVIQVSMLSRQFAVFRSTTRDGTVCITDAYCPHLGASLAAGGSVVRGDCIRCPFHHWEFSGRTGQITRIPYNDRPPPTRGKLKVWPSLEINRTIFVWHHAGGEGPTYEPEVIPEVQGGDWVYQGKNTYEVSCHIQEIPENGADVAHLKAIHSESFMAGGEPVSDSFLSRLMSWTWHEWTVGWAPCSHDKEGGDEGKDHMARVTMTQRASVLGKLNLVELDVKAEQIGPALVHLHFTVKGLGWRGVMIQYVQPVEPMLQKIVHVFYTERRWIPPLAKITLKGECNMLERDVAIWNSKAYLHQPLLATKEDRLLKAYRLWYSQFYSEASLSFRDAMANATQPSLDW